MPGRWIYPGISPCGINQTQGERLVYREEAIGSREREMFATFLILQRIKEGKNQGLFLKGP